VAAINRAYAKSVDWDGMSPLSLNDMPEPWASLKAQAQRLNTEAHQAFMARRRGTHRHYNEWELRNRGVQEMAVPRGGGVDRCGQSATT
jgi:hypothetical protein